MSVTEPTTEDTSEGTSRDLDTPSSQDEATPLRVEERNVLYLAGAICALLIFGLIASATVMLTTTRERELSTAMNDLAHISWLLAEHTQSVIFGTDLILSNLQERITDAGIQTPEALRQYAGTRESYLMLQEMVIISDNCDAVSVFDQNGKIPIDIL